jgi:MFS transporter, CP family, cyanate transporter
VRHSETPGAAGVPPAAGEPRGLSSLRGREVALLVAGITMLAVNLRASITGLPPVFPELSAALHLSSASIAVLAALPVICFGVFSVPAAPLSRRFGEERVLLAALVLLVAGLLLRGAAPGTMLYPGTVLAGAAIALMNVLMPSLIKRRRPEQAGLLIGGYLLTLASGAVVGSLIAVPVFRAAGGAGGSQWAVRLTLGLWALPAAAAALAWLPQVRYRTRPGRPGPEAGMPERGACPRGDDPPSTPRRGASSASHVRVAVHRHALARQVAAFMGLQSVYYYATLSWLPTLFRSRGVSAAGAGDLLALMNLGNAVTAMLIPVLAHRARDQRLLIAATVLASGGGLSGCLFAPVGGAAAWTLLLGFGQGAGLALAIFFTVARAADPVTSASLSGFAQGAGYLIAAAGPLAVGFLHAATGGWRVPVLALLGVLAFELWAGWLAARGRTLPAAGPDSPASPGSVHSNL